MTDDATPAVRAIICTAHLMLLQNPKATLATDLWIGYLILVRQWCEKQEIDGVRYYWHPSIDVDDDAPQTRH